MTTDETVFSNPEGGTFEGANLAPSLRQHGKPSRVGEQNGLAAYASVNNIPSSASRVKLCES